MAQTTVNFNLKTAGFANYANQTLTFRLLTAGAEASTGDESYLVLPGIVTATSAANGDGSVTLFRNGKSAIDSVYEVILPNREKVQFIIPSGTATVELSNLLVNSQPSGSNTQQSSVYDAAIQRANHTGNLTLDSLPNGSITGTLAIANGGTNASSESAARTNLGLGTIATQASNSVNIDGGAIDGAVIGANSAAAGTFSALTSNSVDINGGAIDATVIGASSAAAGTFSALTASTANLTDATDKRLMTDAQETKLDSLSSAAVSNFVPRSITFTNTSAYLSLADNAALDVDAGDFSLSFWARLDSSGTEPVLTKLSGTGYRLKFVSGSLILTMQDSGGSADFTLATGLNDSKWHVYVVTVDRSGNAIAYVDNVAQTAVGVSGTASTLANSGQFQIGSDGGSNAGDGIALGNYIALHKAVLTASQASQIFFSADAAFTALAPSLMVDLRKADKTFADVSASGLAVTTNGTIIFNQDRLTEFTGTNVLATTTLGYTTGSGGTVTQASNKTTAVTLNKINGEIVMNGAALADDATAAFTLTNSTIAATDVVIVNVASVGTAGAYQVTVGAVAAGSCSISVLNVSGGALSEAIKLNFAVIKAVAS